MLRFFVLIGVYYAIAYAAAGWNGVIVAAGQSAVAIFSLELINYIQHYGLERREISPGRYERPDVLHSWNWETRFCGLFFLNLGRHSEHHRVANRPYEALEAVEGQPEVPGGLMAMYLAALVPPVWFAIMNPRVEAVRLRQAATPVGPAAEHETAAPTPLPSSRETRRRQYQALVDAWGGFFIAAVIVAMALINRGHGFDTGVALAIGIGLVVMALREGFLLLPTRRTAPAA
jgi:hypothetical protein